MLLQWFRDVGAALLLAAGMYAITAVVAALWSESDYVWVFLGLALANGALGWLLTRAPRRKVAARGTWRSLSAVALAWATVSFAGAAPLWIGANVFPEPGTASYAAFSSAWFEGMSGFTSTGLTMASDASALPRSIQWWRSFMEWIGGVGVIVLGIAVIENSDRAYALYEAEGRSKRFADSAEDTARKIWKIYIALTLFALAGFLTLGMDPWESVNHALTAASTGGFSIRSDSFESYSQAIQLFTILLTVLAAISFEAHYIGLVRRRGDLLLRKTSLRAFVGLAVGGFAVIWLIGSQKTSAITGLDAAFQAASALGTAGFASADLTQWPPSLLWLLAFAMLIGGCSGSTAGGIKTDRLVWLAKSAVARIESVYREDGDEPTIGFDGETLAPETAHRRVRTAATIAALFVAAAALGVAAMSFWVDAPFERILFDVVSALGGVGLASGVVGPELQAEAKVVLTILMWLGRLELIAVIVLIVTPFRGLARSSADLGGEGVQ